MITSEPVSRFKVLRPAPVVPVAAVKAVGWRGGGGALCRAESWGTPFSYWQVSVSPEYHLTSIGRRGGLSSNM